MRMGLLSAMLIVVAACSGSVPTTPSASSPTPPPLPTPVPPMVPTWTISGTVSDRSGAPVNHANVYLYLYNYGENYSGSVKTDSDGRFTISVTRSPGDGDLITTHSGFARQVDRFSCAAPACTFDSHVEFAITPAKVTGVTLHDPGLIYVGESAPVRREVRLDDGRVINDDGASALLPVFAGDGTHAYDPAIAIVRTTAGGVRHIFGMAPGTATLTTQVGAFRIQIPVHVAEKAVTPADGV
jgi:hypothetical protein